MKHQQGTVRLKTLCSGTLIEKKDGTKGIAETECHGRLGRELDGENCQWDEEMCVCMCVFACMSMCIQAAQPWQNCRRKGNELGENKTRTESI